MNINPIGRFEKVSGTLIVMAFAILILPLVAGSSSKLKEYPDPAGSNAPPFPPDGVFSISGDNKITVSWEQISSPNITKYGIYRHEQATGHYEWIADVKAEDVCEDGTCSFDDMNVVEGETWYYGVTTINNAGLESEYLSYEVICDNRGSEGFGRVLTNLGQNGAADFSEFATQAPGDNTADIYFGSTGDVSHIFPPAAVDIQELAR